MSRLLRNILILTLLLSIRLAAQAKIYYVTLDGKPVTDGWQDITPLATAFTNAVAGDEIWIQGSENVKAGYTVPTTDGLLVKSGVKVYGGFRGTEARTTERVYIDGNRHKMRYRTVLSGDINGDDNIADSHFIFPKEDDGNKRHENANHVLVLDMDPKENPNNTTTVISGLAIARGHADGAQDTEESFGAGIYVKGDNQKRCVFRIESCFFLTNYAWKGGAVYVVETVKHGADKNTIVDCAFFNNAAGLRTKPTNNGAAIMTKGDMDIVNSLIYNNSNGGINGSEASTGDAGINIHNCTIARNSGSGVEGKNMDIYNSVIWGNSSVYSVEKPSFYSSAYIGADPDDGNNNIALNPKNAAETDGPLFVSPSLTTGYDSEFILTDTSYPDWIWELQGESHLIDNGDNSLVANGYAITDLKGNPRIVSDRVDIGAYEYQAVTNRRYVTMNGTGDGTSWENASGNLQNMIDALAVLGGGEVWVAAGTYSPSAYLLYGKEYSASFRMRDNVSVYGGFAGTETSKSERLKGSKSWEYTNETILQGQGYVEPTRNWGDITSSTRHVVWFAPLPGEEDFLNATFLDGVTVKGGCAPGGNGLDDFLTDRGAGIYMKGRHAQVMNCIVMNNYAKGPGAGIFIEGRIGSGDHGGGLVQRSLIFNNISEDDGGGVYMGESGLVRRCMITNNKGHKGAGVFITGVTEMLENIQLSTCIISNNTSTHNGAVYCDNGGILVHNTIVNNQCTKNTDSADESAAQTGGVYIDTYALLINNVLWNNRFGAGEDISALPDIPLYVKNPSPSKVRFGYNAISGSDNAVWNSTRQEETLFLYSENDGDGTEMMYPYFTEEDAEFGKVGVDYSKLRAWQAVTYFWQPGEGSALWSAGLEQGQFPDVVLVAAELDILGYIYANKPSIGAVHAGQPAINPTTDGDKYVLYVSPERADRHGDGSGWDKPYRSINKALEYFAGLTTIPSGIETLEVRVMEGNLWPRHTFVNEDPRSATINFPAVSSGKLLRLVGGYYRDGASVKRDPMIHRSIIEGNRKGNDIEEGNYHLVTVEPNAKIELDGLYIVNGYAYGSASQQQGAGVLAHIGSDVTIRNTIFEDNTAASSAAVYGDAGSKVSMINCVVSNNTNINEDEDVVSAPSLTLEHVSFINNKAKAPALATASGTTSFALNNSYGNSSFNDAIVTTGEEGAKNFANPIKNADDIGAKLGFETYLGGYAVYRPLTSSALAEQHIINQATSGTSADNRQDITALDDRDLGGVPDLGAYEADLPKKGRVYYVRMPENGGDDNHDGLSWSTAFATVRKATETASAGTVENKEKPQVWVAAGVYSQEPKSGSNNCFEILDGVNVYGAFPKTGNPGMTDRHPFISDYIYHDGTYNAADYETILQPSGSSSTRRVLGQEDIYNPFYLTQYGLGDEMSYVNVGAGNGDYERVDEDVYVETEPGKGDYIKSENGGEYVLAAKEYCTHWLCDKDVTYKYFTSGEKNLPGVNGRNYKNLIKVGTGCGEYVIKSTGGWISWDYYESDYTNGDYAEFTKAGYYKINPEISGGKTYYAGNYYEYSNDDVLQSLGLRTHLKTKPDYNYVGEGYGNWSLKAKAGDYYEVEAGKGSYIKASRYEYFFPTCWDGFTLRNGYLDSRQINFLGNSQFNGQNGYPALVKDGRRNGGAGAAFFKNVTLRNSIIYDNHNTASVTNLELRAGGLYADGGTVVNCYILKNKLGQEGQEPSYGGGAYLYSGRVYNTVISENESWATHTDGAGIFIENAEFFNNTITGNVSHGTTRGNGGICIWKSGTSSKLLVYNCISLNNYGFTQDSQTAPKNIGYADVATSGGSISCYNSIFGNAPTNVTGTDKEVLFSNCQQGTAAIFVDNTSAKKNYRLKSGVIAINKGENLPKIGTETIDLSEYTDMDFTARIKDCTVDIGAYELDDIENVKPDLTTESGKAIYYVTQTGQGTSNGDKNNPACAEKLQTILKAAGSYAAAHPGTDVIVKVAGQTNGFKYRATDLAKESNKQSYSIIIPYGITVMGGYKEGTYKAGGGYEGGGTWDDANRDVTINRTIFSPIMQTAAQDINGFHTITFAAKPDTWTGSDKPTIIDGICLTDGSATSLAGGGDDTHGGAAIVPAWGHVRNCLIQGNEAAQGGGLYVLPGGMVSGCLIRNNTASGSGGGVYVEVDNTKAHAHLISNTIVDNTAATGGGIFMDCDEGKANKDDAAMVVNSVVWRNKANSDQNISGILIKKYQDTMLDAMKNHGTSSTASLEWYPYNNCYVENLDLPGTLMNGKMESDQNVYFANEQFELKRFSPLIDHGLTKAMQNYLVARQHVSSYDLTGANRIETDEKYKDEYMDVGAFAFIGETVDKDKVLRRLFVSQNSNYVLTDADKNKEYIGKTFYTPYTWLGDALKYIESLRGKGDTGEFEIFISNGFYTPKYRRNINDNSLAVDIRQNSFSVPYGVKIYGGFTGEEKYSSFVDNATDEEKITKLSFVSGDITDIQPLTDELVQTMLKARKGSDFNDNHVAEAWEMAEQTILSGNINQTDTVQNSFHVVNSIKDASYTGTQHVLLDGVTIQDGRTLSMIETEEANAIGSGGGIYSDGVSYTLVNCRLLNNKAMRGGGAFVRDADLTIVNSMIAGNAARRKQGEAENPDQDNAIIGGGVFLACTGKSATFRAVNTLWANNESRQSGAALGARDAGGNTATISVMNNTFVKNKANNDAVLYHTTGKKDRIVMTNTVMWGNESTDASTTEVAVTYSASDKDYTMTDGTTKLFGPGNNFYNILLKADNMALDGPRFTEPSTVAGTAGFSLNSKWNPIAVSPLTDHGNGTKKADGSGFTGTEQPVDGLTTRSYKAWLETNAREYADWYMHKQDGEAEYLRYAGPMKEDGTQDDMTIDIGVHEYQYVTSFSTMDYIYVATESSGTGKGDSWQNATDDLRGALIGAANPTSNDPKERVRHVYVKSGEYPWAVPTNENALFPVYIGGNIDLEWNSLEIKGSCIGSGDEQDFSKPTILRRHPFTRSTQPYLMEISSAHSSPKNVTISGITFRNNVNVGDVGDDIKDLDEEQNAHKGGVSVLSNNGTLTMKNVAFHNNPKNGMEVNGNTGKLLIVNALFADNGGIGLMVGENPDKTVLVNTTFVNNTVDMVDEAIDIHKEEDRGKLETAKGLTNVYNSTAWRNLNQKMTDDRPGKHNWVFGSDIMDNNDIKTGPNFMDPQNAVVNQRDYRIRPSKTLLNKGSNALYLKHALNDAFTEIPETEKELYNELRQVGDYVDIGAYEYRADLKPIIYVKEGVVNSRLDGSSWDTAIDNLQNAANLAGVYAEQFHEPAYVFAHSNVVQRVPLNVNLADEQGWVKIYGGMNDEISSTVLPSEPSDPDAVKDAAKTIADELLRQRQGLLESAERSKLPLGLSITSKSVVDGFEIGKDAPLVLHDGILSTSIVNHAVQGTGGGTSGGVLYNSFVDGDVTGVETVNVTATGTIEENSNNGNNRPSATGDNKYVKDDYWNYQLNETSADIDAGTKEIDYYIEMVGHDHDVAGNKRIRGNVDNGCFETWNVKADTEVTEEDYPHGKSVVYVRNVDDNHDAEGAELKITKVYNELKPFSPGFLLLEHRAGLRTNGKHVNLYNFAVERIMDGQGADMAAMPFDVIKTEGEGVTRQLYDGSERAKHDYKFSADDSKAWKAEADLPKGQDTDGWLLTGAAGGKVRFYGNAYQENIVKTVDLMRYNYVDNWNAHKFTHKENMSWNLFGSPYLCAMNYDDMPYGRVMYRYQDGAYHTFNTIGKEAEGYIPAGDAVFTQTATLRERESLSIARPGDGKKGKAYIGNTALSVALASAGGTRAAGNHNAGDLLQLKAVPADEAHNDFDINSDGVKWMAADSVPQLFAVIGGGRYSLLSAVSIEGEVSVGVSLPEAGAYTFSVPEDCDVDGYETVVLKDSETGKLVDLLEQRYDFSVLNAGDVTGRFTISFNRMLDGKVDRGIRVWSPKRNTVRVDGTDSGDVITVYSASGSAITSRVASSAHETLSVPMQDVVIVEVRHAGTSIVKKVWDTK